MNRKLISILLCVLSLATILVFNVSADGTAITEASTLMYDIYGNSAYVPSYQVEAHKSVGWFLEPTTVMYDIYGNSAYVPSYQVEAHKSVGWFLEPVTLMYDIKGNTAYVPNSQVEAHKSVGWYKTYAEAQSAKAAASYSYSNSYQNTNNNRPNSGGSAVYRTPSGKRYHYDPDCGGKNSYRTTLQGAKSSGLTPCKKCAS